MKNKWLILVVLFFTILIGYSFYNFLTKASYNGFYTVSCIDNNKKPVRNYSFIISISVLGKKYQLPKNLGHKNAKCINEIYSDNSNGVINVKTNEFKSFTLGNLFNVLNETFNKDVFLGHKISNEHTLEVYVNGRKTNMYENTPLFPNSRIEIVYK